jgi:predicted nucleotidyltransferase
LTTGPAPLIDVDTERAARVFLKRLEGRFAILQCILYGGRARGDHAPDSDADLAVIIGGERGDRVAASLEMAGLAFDVMMETGILVQSLPLWDEEFRRPETFSNPALIANILRDGISL